MNNSYLVIGIAAIIVAVGGWYAFNKSAENGEAITPHESTMLSAVEIIPIEHASAIVRIGERFVYVDPTGGAAAYPEVPPPNVVLITDIHGDHMHPETITAVIGDAELVVPQAVKDQLPASLASRARVLNNGESATVAGVLIEAVPMYNIPGSENANFHTKGRGNGYVLEADGIRVYIAGDTAGTPEMRAMQDIDIALVPMNLPYTMSVQEAADAVLAFKPRQVYPYHYRGQGGLADVAEFKRLVAAGDSSIDVVLADWYKTE